MESLWGSIRRAEAHYPVVVATDEEIHKQIWETAAQARVTLTDVNLHVMDQVASQWKDCILRTVIHWIPNREAQDLKHHLGDDTNTVEGVDVIQEERKLTLYQGTLYHCHTLAGKLEEVMWLVIPMAHHVAAMNGCHRDATHKCEHQMLNLLQGQFLWPSIATQMQKGVSNCKQCIQHEGTCAKVLCDILLPINCYTGNITTKCHTKSMSENRDLTETFHQKVSSLPVSIASDSRYFQS